MTANRKDKSLRIMSQRFVSLFLVSESQCVTLETAAQLLIDHNATSHSKYKSKTRPHSPCHSFSHPVTLSLCSVTQTTSNSKYKSKTLSQSVTYSVTPSRESFLNTKYANCGLVDFEVRT